MADALSGCGEQQSRRWCDTQSDEDTVIGTAQEGVALFYNLLPGKKTRDAKQKQARVSPSENQVGGPVGTKTKPG